MKFSKINFFFIVCFALICLAFVNTAQAQDGDGPAAKRIPPRRPVGKSSKTTTTSAPAEYDAEYPDGENIDQYGDEGAEGAAPSSTTTSTEPPKKVGPVIRPFRSNDDFLNSLKRRQMDAKKNRAEKIASRSKSHEVAHNDNEEDSPAPAPIAKISKPAPGGASANRRKFTKNVKPEPQADDTDAEGSEQQEKEETKPKRPHPRLALRKRS